MIMKSLVAAIDQKSAQIKKLAQEVRRLESQLRLASTWIELALSEGIEKADEVLRGLDWNRADLDSELKRVVRKRR